MGIISDILESDASFQFDTDTTPGVESITLTPKGGTARSVNANVFRDPPERMEGAGNIKKPKALLQLRNHATAGVLMSEVKTGLKVTFNLRAGAESETLQASLASDVESDAGTIWLEV